MHELPLITTIASGLTCAWVLGLLTQRLGLSPIVGYLLAGVLIGPQTPGFQADLEIAHQLAELGVILLMFGVGLHFHLKDLLAVKNIAIPGAVGQSLVATIVAILVFTQFGISIKTSAVIGMAMAVASTVVLMRVLMDAGVLNTVPGHIAVGWLIVEDIFTVVLLVLIPVLGDSAAASGDTAQAASATASNLLLTLGIALLKLAALIAVVLVAGARIVPWVMVRVARLRSRELFTLTVLVFSIAIAAGSYYIFGASMALGAFLAGMMVGQSPVSHQAAADALPMRDAFAVLFFVSVGMLFDPLFVWQQPLMILAGLGIILIAKPLAALAIVAVLGQPARTALTVAIGLAQIGEFSFILSELARQHGLMPDDGHNLLVAAAIISITINPMLFRSLPAIESWLQRHPRLWKLLNGRAERRATEMNQSAALDVAKLAENGERQALVIGFGPVGRSVLRLLKDAGLSTVVIDLNMDTIAELNSQGQTAIFGDASHESILKQAGVERASHVVLTLPGSADRAAVVTAVRNLNESARLLVRARYLREREDLERSGATAAVFEEAEAAVALARLVLADTGVHREAAERKVRDLRLQLIKENMSNLRTQRVRSVMVPWTRVRRLLTSASRDEVLKQVSQHRFTRWPVVEPDTGRVLGYLLTKDLIAEAATADWQSHIRPLQAIPADDGIEGTLTRMQSEGATMYAVEDRGNPVGLITFEDILEQVVGRIEDEYRHETEISLCDAVRVGAVVLDLTATTRDEAIEALTSAIPDDRLPVQAEHTHILERALDREAEISTDLGIGVAIPHARCPNLRAPLLVVGRSADGIEFSSPAAKPVYLIFLLVTPTEQPEAQLSLLSQLARFVADESNRQQLMQASSEGELIDLLCRVPLAER
ncbi:MAG: cation:proton antiporter [Pirellulales bacterium]